MCCRPPISSMTRAGCVSVWWVSRPPQGCRPGWQHYKLGSEAMRICLHGYVSGKVQGVSFRQATAEQAERLDLAGWVEQGPEQAQVAAVELEEQALQGVVGFIVRR